MIQKLYLDGNSRAQITKITGASAKSVKKYTEGLEPIDKMIGEKFGRLEVLSRAEKDPTLASRCLRYVCKCECGKEVIVNSGSLRSGHTTSCGCARKGVRVKDLTNKRFGFLVAVQFTGKTDEERRAIWQCQCDCGKEIEVTSHLLLEGSIKSCGCSKESLGEKRVREILEKLQWSFISQYKFPDCKNIRELPFDFAIFDGERLLGCIEYQGDIHYKTTGGWNTSERLQENQKRDLIKKEYCQQNNIPLLIIPYWDYDKIDTNYIKKGLLNGL